LTYWNAHSHKESSQVSLTRDSRHGFKFPSLIPATIPPYRV